jgi:hypothetical protein
VSDFKIKDFLDRLNNLGLMLSATRLADGSIRLNQWRRINFYENEAEQECLDDQYGGPRYADAGRRALSGADAEPQSILAVLIFPTIRRGCAAVVLPRR